MDTTVLKTDWRAGCAALATPADPAAPAAPAVACALLISLSACRFSGGAAAAVSLLLPLLLTSRFDVALAAPDVFLAAAASFSLSTATCTTAAVVAAAAAAAVAAPARAPRRDVAIVFFKRAET